jgi:DNA-binding PadR family transcriptional regulator
MDQQVLSKLFNLNKAGDALPNSWELSLEFKVDHKQMVSVLNSLNANNYIKMIKKSEKKFQLTAEGT